MQESTSLYLQAGTLMLVGMLFVYAFLSLLVAVIKYLITPLATIFPDAPQSVNKSSVNKNSPSRASAKPAAANSNSVSPPVVAAISAAIKRHRQNK